MLAGAAVLRGSAPLHDPDCLSSGQIKNEHSRPLDGLRGACCETPRTAFTHNNSLMLSDKCGVPLYRLSQKWLFTISLLETVPTEDQSPLVSVSFSHCLSLPGPGEWHAEARAGAHQSSEAPARCSWDPSSAERAGGGGYHGDSCCGSDWLRRPDPAPSIPRRGRST